MLFLVFRKPRYEAGTASNTSPVGLDWSRRQLKVMAEFETACHIHSSIHPASYSHLAPAKRHREQTPSSCKLPAPVKVIRPAQL